MAMQSYWSVTYAGPHHGVFIKKLERLAKFKALELERERFILHEEKIEHSMFLVQHDSTNWEDLVIEILHTARIILPVWMMSIGSKDLSGHTSRNMEGPNVEYQMRLAGLRSMEWEVNEAQNYKRKRWLGVQPDRW